MKTKRRQFHARMFCVVALGMGSSSSSAAEFSDANWMSMGGIPGANGPVYAAVVDDTGNLYIGGEFTIVGDVFANHIARWNGTNWSALGSGMDNAVRALAVSGSSVYAGGEFTTAGGGPANRIAKWDGSNWSALGLGMSNNPGYSPAVYALAVSGNDLYVGGYFLTAGEKVSAYIARAYLPILPTLSMAQSGGAITVSWPSVNTTDFLLEQADILAAATSWLTNSASTTDDGTTKSVTLPPTNSAQFFRLRRP